MNNKIIVPDHNELTDKELFLLDIMEEELNAYPWWIKSKKYIRNRHFGKEYFDCIFNLWQYECCLVNNYDYEDWEQYRDYDEFKKYEGWDKWIKTVRPDYKPHGFSEKELNYMSYLDIDDCEAIDYMLEGNEIGYSKDEMWRYCYNPSELCRNALHGNYLAVVEKRYPFCNGN